MNETFHNSNDAAYIKRYTRSAVGDIENKHGGARAESQSLRRTRVPSKATSDNALFTASIESAIEMLFMEYNTALFLIKAEKLSSDDTSNKFISG